MGLHITFVYAAIFIFGFRDLFLIEADENEKK